MNWRSGDPITTIPFKSSSWARRFSRWLVETMMSRFKQLMEGIGSVGRRSNAVSERDKQTEHLWFASKKAPRVTAIWVWVNQANLGNYATSPYKATTIKIPSSIQVNDRVNLMAYKGTIAIIWQFLSNIFPFLQLWFHHVHKPYSLKNIVLKNNLLGELNYYLNVKNLCHNMAMSIWRCHILADTPTSPLTEPAYHTDNSENSLKYEQIVTKHANTIT